MADEALRIAMHPPPQGERAAFIADRPKARSIGAHGPVQGAVLEA